MASRTANLIIRTLRIAPIVAALFSGCTCSGDKPGPPAPAPTHTIQAVAKSAPTVAEPTLAPVAEVPPTERPVPAAEVTAMATARQTACEGFVRALLTDDGDESQWDKPEVQAVGMQATDLVVCAAVLRDSDAVCRRLMPEERGPGMECRKMQSIFHELRANPKGRTFMFGALDLEECRRNSVLGATCDAFQVAIRSGDVEKCASTGDLQPMCRAYLSLDPSLCKFSPEAETRLKKGLEKPPDHLDEMCKETITSRKFLAQGLAVIAESGGPREREFAKAALRRADACASFREAAVRKCLEGSTSQADSAERLGSSATEPSKPAGAAPAQAPPS